MLAFKKPNSAASTRTKIISNMTKTMRTSAWHQLAYV